MLNVKNCFNIDHFTWITHPKDHNKTAQNENVILTETHQVLPSLLRSTNQAAGELEGLLPCTATETGGFVCIRSYSVVEDEAEGGSSHSQLWLRSEQLPKTSKSRATCKTFFARLQVKHTVCKGAFRCFQCAPLWESAGVQVIFFFFFNQWCCDLWIVKSDYETGLHSQP